MSQQSPVTKVPDGQTPFYTTRQLAPNEKGSAEYETVWKLLQKQVDNKTPSSRRRAHAATSRSAKSARETAGRVADREPSPRARSVGARLCASICTSQLIPVRAMADRRLQVFHAVAKQLSFTRAAKALCMTQPAVTSQIRQLEEHFNTRLFDRGRESRSLPRAPSAWQYVERILEIMAELSDNRLQEMSGRS